VISNHNAGTLRILAVTSAKRSAEIPDVPSIAETLPGYDATLWSGLLAPKGTPAAVIRRIHSDLAKVMARPDVQAAFKRTGTDPMATEPKAFGDVIRTDYRKWGDVVREIKLQLG